MTVSKKKNSNSSSSYAYSGGGTGGGGECRLDVLGEAGNSLESVIWFVFLV